LHGPEAIKELLRRAREAILKCFAGMVPMDRARQDWFYEHAETGRPGRPNDEDPLAGTPV
jgi:hypothetical protein